MYVFRYTDFKVITGSSRRGLPQTVSVLCVVVSVAFPARCFCPRGQPPNTPLSLIADPAWVPPLTVPCLCLALRLLDCGRCILSGRESRAGGCWWAPSGGLEYDVHKERLCNSFHSNTRDDGR